MLDTRGGGICAIAGLRLSNRLGPLDRAVSTTSHEVNINGFPLAAIFRTLSTAAGSKPTLMRTSDCHNPSWQRRGASYSMGVPVVFCDGMRRNGGLRAHALQDVWLGPFPMFFRPSCRFCPVRCSRQRSRMQRSARTLVTARRVRTDALAALRLQPPPQTTRASCLGNKTDDLANGGASRFMSSLGCSSVAPKRVMLLINLPHRLDNAKRNPEQRACACCSAETLIAPAVVKPTPF